MRIDVDSQLVVFALDDRHYALCLSAVERIIRAVEVTPLPLAPTAILGTINLRGMILPVFDVRQRFRHLNKDVDLSDHLIVARTHRRTVALVADLVLGVVAQRPEEATPGDEIWPGLDYVAGAVKLESGLVFIHDLDTFLSEREEKELDEALAMPESR